jgi:ribonuclease R
MKETQKKPSSGRVLTGSLSVSGKGVGYFSHTDLVDDLEIQPNKLNKALHNDEVEVIELDSKGFPRKQGEVVKILGRAKTQFVGTVDSERGVFFLVPDDRRFYKDINLGIEAGLEKGTKAVVSLTSWDEKGPQGKIVKILGKKGLHNVEMESIVFEKGFDTTFPADVEKEAEHLEKTEKPIPEKEIKKRRDFRKTTTYTIDPVDAKDFDDAISLKDLGNGHYEIGVHIADVSHYVRPGTKLDKEASKRCFSVYLVDRTIPMLPEVLSNDICSLNPHEDKLTFSAVFTIDLKGNITDRWFGKTVINSAKRFSYEAAQETLNAGSGEHFAELDILNKIALRLRIQKFAKGAIDFEKDEVRFELDKNGKPLRVYKKQRLATHLLVEDYMLLANREVAEYIMKENERLHQKGGAFIYRIHDKPDQEKLASLAIFIKALGFDLESHGGHITALSIKKLLADVTGKPEESLIKTATIRSMAKAIYSTENIGHFGLAFDYYTHFTSPIRRYPDLLVHRVLEHYLQGERIPSQDLASYDLMAARTSEREVMAAEAERASIKYKQVEYMSEHVGETFTGIISGVTEWGLYVEEEDTKCEGMIKLRELTDDFYSFDEKNYRVVGQKNKKKLTLGDKIRFKVLNADIEKKMLDYGIAQ